MKTKEEKQGLIMLWLYWSDPLAQNDFDTCDRIQLCSAERSRRCERPPDDGSVSAGISEVNKRRLRVCV